MVSEASAAQSMPGEALHSKIAIDADHSQIVKFISRPDQNYQNVRTKLVDFVEGAKKCLSERELRGM